jgi:nitrate reductase gamma subunit
MTLSEFILGPLWQVSLVVFCVGIVWRIAAILLRGFPSDPAPARGSGALGALGTLLRRAWPRNGLSRENLLPMVAGYGFHLGLLALLFFAAPHVRFLEQHLTGFGWAALPHWGFILAAELAFAGLILLWLRRLMHPVTRLLTTLDDHLAAGITFFAMLTGCLALFESFEGLRVLHVFGVELLMLYFPFSNLMHAFTLFISRGASGAAAGRRGVRA